MRARRLATRVWSVSYLTVTNTAGVRITFRDNKDIPRTLGSRVRAQHDRALAEISRLAEGVLGTQPLPRWASAVWTLASAELPALMALACAVTIMPIVAR